MSGNELGLAQALEALRDELQSALQSGEGKRVRFRASEVTLTMETVARLDKEGSGKIRWYVLEAGAAVKSGTEHTQTLTLSLAPILYDKEGRQTPLDVAGEQSVPGR
ncbi:trypco2 family protein [Streptomyces bobili]|uniref:Trypsin-co-occurring domain-containing protein n=1 Tax=Streptomyces bobili TaxID=67280 RepID=A0ABZ1R4A2_9ACTN|nr:trypco2 family protein [Streptomyces bobili]